MRTIEIERELRVRFSQRGAEFDDGVEVGIMAAQMAAGLRRISRVVHPALVPQLHALALRMRYRVEVAGPGPEEGSVVAEAIPTGERPKLRVVR